MGRLKKIPKRVYNFIDYDDWIEKEGGRRLYKASCKECGSDRGYKRPNKFMQTCKKCSNAKNRLKITKKHREEHSKRMINRIPWNKGQTKETNDSLIKISKAMSKREVKLETRIKSSCTQRGIQFNEFDDFTNNKNDKERLKFKGYRLNHECLQKANFTCDISGQKGIKLVAHHLNSWNLFPEQRFDLNNLVCMSEELHKKFHSLYGYGNNTKDQYNEFKDKWRKNGNI